MAASVKISNTRTLEPAVPLGLYPFDLLIQASREPCARVFTAAIIVIREMEKTI